MQYICIGSRSISALKRQCTALRFFVHRSSFTAHRFYNAEISSFERPVVWAMVATSTPQALRLRAISTVFRASPSALPFASPFFSAVSITLYQSRYAFKVSSYSVPMKIFYKTVFPYKSSWKVESAQLENYFFSVGKSKFRSRAK